MEKRMAVKDYITEALFILIHKKNYDEITITDITNKAGVSRISFYRNFESKEDIIRKHLDKVINEYSFNWDSDSDQIYQVFNFLKSNKDTIDILYKSGKQYLMVDHLLNSYGYNENLSNIEAYSQVSVAYLIFGWCDEWYKRGMQESPEEMSKLFHH